MIRGLWRGFVTRFHDVLLSVYLHNERQGFTYLETLAGAFAQRYPAERGTLEAIRKHALDERKHYDMFRHWFLAAGRRPFVIPARVGYCEGMVLRVFGKTLEEIAPEAVVADERAFFRLCRLVMITERRGLRQAMRVLANPVVRLDPSLVRIFEVIRSDEPSHFEPYAEWLRRHGEDRPMVRERLADLRVHLGLLYFKLPLLFLNPVLRRAEAMP